MDGELRFGMRSCQLQTPANSFSLPQHTFRQRYVPPSEDSIRTNDVSQQTTSAREGCPNRLLLAGPLLGLNGILTEHQFVL